MWNVLSKLKPKDESFAALFIAKVFLTSVCIPVDWNIFNTIEIQLIKNTIKKHENTIKTRLNKKSPHVQVKIH